MGWSVCVYDMPHVLGFTTTLTRSFVIVISYNFTKKDSMDEAQDYLKGRIKMVAKRFREPGDTENEIKKMESKRKRNAKKQLEEEKAHANAKNNEYLLNEMSKINSNITITDKVR